MRDTYSLYEAKANLSAILRQVRAGRSVIVTLHGQPVAEIRPIAPAHDLATRLSGLADRGILIRPDPDAQARPVRTVARRPGALRRFLAERNG